MFFYIFRAGLANFVSFLTSHINHTNDSYDVRNKIQESPAITKRLCAMHFVGVCRHLAVCLFRFFKVSDIHHKCHESLFRKAN